MGILLGEYLFFQIETYINFLRKESAITVNWLPIFLFIVIFASIVEFWQYLQLHLMPPLKLP